MTIKQYQVIKIAKAIEYYDQFIPALGTYDEKANKAIEIQQVLEDAITALYNNTYWDIEKVNKALKIADKLESL